MTLPLTQIPVPVASDAVSHTPGPWCYVLDEDKKVISIYSVTKRESILDATNDPDLADDNSIIGGIWGVDSKQDFANAQLMIASPDLLREIEKEIAWLEHIKPQISSIESVLVGFNQAIKYLKAVASKAKGES